MWLYGIQAPREIGGPRTVSTNKKGPFGPFFLRLQKDVLKLAQRHLSTGILESAAFFQIDLGNNAIVHDERETL